jgi:hypothetical protein
MPVITTTGTVNLQLVPRGQRLFTYRPEIPLFEIHKFYIDIQTSTFTFEVLEDVVTTSYTVTGVQVDYGGAGLSSSTQVTFSAPDVDGGVQLVGTPVITTGTITSIDITTTGTGYVYHPDIVVYDPESPFTTGTSTIAVLYMFDPNSGTTATTTFSRGSITGTTAILASNPMARGQTLWALEVDVVDVVQNRDPEHVGINLTEHFPNLNRVPFNSTSTSLINAKYWAIHTFISAFHRTKLHRTSSLERNPTIKGQRTATRVTAPITFFIHDDNIDDFTQMSWHLHMRTQTPTNFLTGPSASDWSAARIAGQMAQYNGPEHSSEYRLLEDIWCVIPDGPVSAGTTIPVQITTAPGIEYVYVEQECGVPDRTKVTLTNGTGTFNIITTSLQPGDVASAKVGFKTWTNIETVEIPLS